jgi:putative ABC transport system permease protein
LNLSPLLAAARIGWRQARRAPWRSALVAVMVALPIAALSGTAVVIHTVMPTPQQLATEAMGRTDIVIQEWSEGLRTRSLRRELPPGTRIYPGRVLYSQNIVHGSSQYLIVEEFPIPVDRPPLTGRLVMLAGRAPARAGEVAMQPDVLAAFGARIGDQVHLEDARLTLRVTGTIVAPGQIREPLAAVGSGTLGGQADAGLEGYWIDLPPGASVERAAAALAKDPQVHGFATRSQIAHQDDGASAVANAGAFAAAALALFATGLIAAAAFVVGARRQLRMLGLVGSQGGEPRHVLATVLFGAVSLGLVGSAAGLAIGVIGSLALHPVLARIAGRLVGQVRLPLLPLLGAMALGTAAATLAALGPARSAARLSTLEALAGRTPPPGKPGRRAVAGLLGAAAGVALTAWGTIGNAGLPLGLGLILTVGGFLVATPLLVSGVGRLAGQLPTIPRLAARDMARNGRRTGAAMAAATMALALPIAVSAVTLSNEAGQQRTPYMGPDQLSVSLSAPEGHVERRVRELLADLRATFPASLVVRLVPARVAAEPLKPGSAGSVDPTVYVQGGTAPTDAGESFVRTGTLWIGGPDLLRAFHAEGGIAALDAGKVVSVGPDSTDGGVAHLLEDRHGERHLLDLPAVEAGSTRYQSLSNAGEFNYVLSPAAATRAGLIPSMALGQEVQFVLRAPGTLEHGDIAEVKAVAARHPGAFVVSPEDLGSHGGPVRRMMSLGGAGVALAILAVVLALVGAESRRDRAILVAVGAEPRIRRELAGANGFLTASLAGALAVPAGLVPAIAYLVSQRIGNPVVVPWSVIGLVLLGVPLVAAAFAALGSRPPEAARMLRPLA